MKTTMKVEGFKELDAAIGELSKATARNVMRRALLKAGEPMRAEAERLAPKDTGKLAGDMTISTKLKGGAKTDGKAAYSAARKAGATGADAVAAMRDAQRGSAGGFSAEVYVGPKSGNKQDAIKAIVQELGSLNQPPQPYMRPAFDATRSIVVDGVRREMGTEMEKAKVRAAKRAAKRAAAGS